MADEHYATDSLWSNCTWGMFIERQNQTPFYDATRNKFSSDSFDRRQRSKLSHDGI